MKIKWSGSESNEHDLTGLVLRGEYGQEYNRWIDIFHIRSNNTFVLYMDNKRIKINIATQEAAKTIAMEYLTNKA